MTKMHMQRAQSKLKRLLEAHEATAGLYVRVHGDHLILGRREPLGPGGETEDDDRVRQTRLSAYQGISELMARCTSRRPAGVCQGRPRELVALP